MPKRIVSRPIDPDTGKRLRLVCSSKAELEQALRRIGERRQRIRLERTLNDALREGTTLEVAIALYLESDLSPATRDNVASFRTAAAEFLPVLLERLDAPAVERWIGRLKARKLAASSIRSYWHRLQAIAQHALRLQRIARLPWDKYRPRLPSGRPQGRECCRTVDELGRLLDAARTLDEKQTGRAIEAKIALSAGGGLRQSELAALRWHDVDELGAVVHIPREAKRPAAFPSAADVRVDTRVLEALRVHRVRLEARELFAADGPVFPSPYCRPGHLLPYPGREVLLRSQLRAAVEAAGLPEPERWSAHSMRDTFCTLELAAGRDVFQVAERSRHRSPRSLVRYIHAPTRELLAPGFSLAKGPPALPPAAEKKPARRPTRLLAG